MLVSPPFVFADMQISANTSVKTIEGEQPHRREQCTVYLQPNVTVYSPRPPTVHRSLHVPVCNARSTNSAPRSHAISVPLSDTRTASSPHSTKSVITKPQNVCVMRDIMCSGYVAGGNTRWFGAPDTTNKLGPAPVNGTSVVSDINARLSFEDDATGEYASMLAFACPYAEVETASRDQVISITDRLLPWEVSKAAPAEKSYFPGGKTNYDRYKAMWQLNQIHFGEDVRSTENMSFMSQVRAANLNTYTRSLQSRHTTHGHQDLTTTLASRAAGRREQRPVLPRPAPQVQPVRAELLRARPRPGPLWSRRHPRRRERLGARTRP